MRILIAAAVLTLACSGHPTTPEPSPTPSQPLPPNLSGPQRFRPVIGPLSVVPREIRVDEVAAISGTAVSPFPEGRVDWMVMVESSSTGNGVIERRSGSGDVRAEFRANYPGDVSVLVYAVDDRGVPALPQRLAIMVQR